MQNEQSPISNAWNIKWREWKCTWNSIAKLRKCTCDRWPGVRLVLYDKKGIPDEYGYEDGYRGRNFQLCRTAKETLEKYDVNFCYLFGSYAKGRDTPSSDVDLLISANVRGLKFYGLVEELRTALQKRVDVLDTNQLKENLELIEEILKDGVKIYG